MVEIQAVQVGCSDDVFEIRTSASGTLLAQACGFGATATPLDPLSVYQSNTNTAVITLRSGPTPDGSSGFSVTYWCSAILGQGMIYIYFMIKQHLKH